MTDKERELFTQSLNLITELDKNGTVLEMGLILEMREVLAKFEQGAAWQGNGGAGYNVGGARLAKPEREWVGLTDDERNRYISYTAENFAAGVLWAETKLRERNT